MKRGYRFVHIALTPVLMAGVLLTGAAKAQVGTTQGDKTQSPCAAASQVTTPPVNAEPASLSGSGTPGPQVNWTCGYSSNILVRKDLRPVVAKLLSLSPTFRRQYQRILSSRDLRVTISLVAPMGHLLYHARCIIERAKGLAFVNMEIVALSSYAEVIGHEFEHLLEQLDGLDLRALAGKKGSGVVRQADGSFETSRAISAGQTVEREYFEHLHAR